MQAAFLSLAHTHRVTGCQSRTEGPGLLKNMELERGSHTDRVTMHTWRPGRCKGRHREKGGRASHFLD